jgi:(p)ppGpp synthase/HD superfamily hydrolase
MSVITETHDRAFAFAQARHIFDRYDGGPYEAHLLRVESILAQHGFTDAMWRAAGLLHDVIEDTGTTRGEIETMFGANVADLVWACTGIGTDRKSRQRDIARKITLLPAAAPIKVADRIDNIEQARVARSRGYQIELKYRRERPDFAEIANLETVPQEMRNRLYRAYENAEAWAFSRDDVRG